MPELPDPKARPHPWHAEHSTAAGTHCGTTPQSPAAKQIDYAELQVTSNFTFLTGASHPDELAVQAAALGYRAIAITDCNTLAGIVRGHVAAKKAEIPFVVGCRLSFNEDHEESKEAEVSR